MSSGLFNIRSRIAELAKSTGAAKIGFLQSGTGAKLQTLEAKAKEAVSVADYTSADPTGATDSLAAFSSAIDAMPAAGGTIKIPPGIWSLSADPAYSNVKSINWDISPGATFTGAGSGAGKFPAMLTNTDQIAVGPYLRGYTNATGLSTAVHNVEVKQITSIGASNICAQYLGVVGDSSNAAAWMWGQNIVVLAQGSAAGTYTGIEIDCGIGAGTVNATANGIALTGSGVLPCNAAIQINHQIGWKYGVQITGGVGIGFSHIPLVGDLTTCTPIMIGPAIMNAPGIAMVAKQLTNNKDTIQLRANTNVAPTGNAIRLVNADNTATLWTLDINGNIQMPTAYINASQLIGGNIRATGAVAGVAGNTSFGNTTAATVGAAGGASALPATPLGYIIAAVGITTVKIPYYKN
ncbi:hypothetical protein HUU62_04370 [Rhodoferax sp. 4810]|nr:hypothetical protein [Rhodoferax jenense]